MADSWVECPVCRDEAPVVEGKIAYHDFPKFCRRVCKGAKLSLEVVSAMLKALDEEQKAKEPQ